MPEDNLLPPKPPEPVEPSQVRKPATWENKPATAPWCPEAIRPHLGFEVDYRDNYEVEESASPGWNILAATRRGRMHAHHGTHREDAFHFGSEKDFTVVAVSDGAGSYQHSRIGSESASRKVVEALVQVLTSRREEWQKLSSEEFNLQIQNAIGEAVQMVCTFLQELANKSGAVAKDFRCTLLLGVLWLAGESPQMIFSQVGDGFMAAQGRDGAAKRYGESDSGEFSGEVNCFIPDADAVRNAQKVVAIGAANADAFIFCSDGIEDPFYPTAKNSQRIFEQLRQGVNEPLTGFEKQEPHEPVLGAPQAREKLAAWLGFEKKGENDDRTILILHRLPSEITTAPAIGAGNIASAQPAADSTPAIATQVTAPREEAP